jgi:hypothetical protein
MVLMSQLGLIIPGLLINDRYPDSNIPPVSEGDAAICSHTNEVAAHVSVWVLPASAFREDVLQVLLAFAKSMSSICTMQCEVACFAVLPGIALLCPGIYCITCADKNPSMLCLKNGTGLS